MTSSDILTLAQHWIEEPSEIIGEETAVQFPYFGLGINLSRCYTSWLSAGMIVHKFSYLVLGNIYSYYGHLSKLWLLGILRNHNVGNFSSPRDHIEAFSE